MQQTKSNKLHWGVLVGLSLITAAVLTLLFRSRGANPRIPPDSVSSSRTKSDPNDKDADGLKDDFELTFYHELDESTDTDKDSLPDKLEMRVCGSLSRSEDKDRDGLPDAWELTYFGNLNQKPTDDPDGDGLTNLQELARGRGFNPARPTKVLAWKDAEASANVSGQQSIAGAGKRAEDGKIYYKKTYDRLVQQGKFKIPWEELK